MTPAACTGDFLAGVVVGTAAVLTTMTVAFAFQRNRPGNLADRFPSHTDESGAPEGYRHPEGRGGGSAR